MLLTGTWLLALVLLAGFRDTQSCNSEPENSTVITGHNLALGRPACQSSTYPHSKDLSAGKAVDGNPDGFFTHGSCARTKSEDEPWWYVDLGERYAISHVLLKSQDCCRRRLLRAEIRVGDSVADHGKSNPLCGNITVVTHHAFQDINCEGLKGRYVSVNHPGTPASLTLCEVEVYGTKLEDEP